MSRIFRDHMSFNGLRNSFSFMQPEYPSPRYNIHFLKEPSRCVISNVVAYYSVYKHNIIHKTTRFTINYMDIINIVNCKSCCFMNNFVFVDGMIHRYIDNILTGLLILYL
jgi:hypothetical protein